MSRVRHKWIYYSLFPYLSVGVLESVDAALVEVRLRECPRLQVIETRLDQLCLGLQSLKREEVNVWKNNLRSHDMLHAI